MLAIRMSVLVALIAALAAGCSGGGSELSAEEQKKMEDAIQAGKGGLDLNKVPPEHRERVKAFMQGQGGAAPPAPK
ncbi:MAG: hypothetical protein N2109_03945 [Fimbriimonadales bacterium]|nr:hypothetical protein [Fimbriimonadales bacterium]